LSCALLKLAVATNPRDAESWSQLGHNEMHATRADYDAAARCFETSVSLSGGRDFAALCDCATAQAAQSHQEASLASSRAALALGPPPGPSAAAEARTARQLEGAALLALARFEEASLAFFDVTEDEPSALEAWASLGVCMDALGQADAALNCRREVLRIKLGA